MPSGVRGLLNALTYWKAFLDKAKVRWLQSRECLLRTHIKRSNHSCKSLTIWGQSIPWDGRLLF